MVSLVCQIKLSQQHATPRVAQLSFSSNHSLLLVISPHTANCKWDRNNVQPDLTLKIYIFLKSYAIFPQLESHSHELSSDEAAEHTVITKRQISSSGYFPLARMSRDISLDRKVLRGQKLLSVTLSKNFDTSLGSQETSPGRHQECQNSLPKTRMMKGIP